MRPKPMLSRLAVVVLLGLVAIAGSHQAYLFYADKVEEKKKIETEIADIFRGACWQAKPHGDSLRCEGEANQKTRTFLSLSDEAEKISMLMEACRRNKGIAARAHDEWNRLQIQMGQAGAGSSWEICRNEARDIVVRAGR